MCDDCLRLWLDSELIMTMRVEADRNENNIGRAIRRPAHGGLKMIQKLNTLIV